MMLSFTDYDIIEKTQEGKHTLHAFDLDNTLFDHDQTKLRVHVLDHTGKRVQTLTNMEYNNHKLPDNHSYDYREFTSSDLFIETAKPIVRMITRLKSALKNGDKVEIVTARSDLDDQKKFAHHMKKYGIDIDEVHVRRVGNENGNVPDLKAKCISNQILTHGFNDVHLYDDTVENLHAFLKLKKKFPEVEFTAHHVQYDPETGKVELTTTKAE